MKGLIEKFKELLGMKSRVPADPIEKQMTQYWIGYFNSTELFSDFIQEVYTEDDEKPLSKFIGSQGERWLDHDFMESHISETKSELMKCLFSYSSKSEWSKHVVEDFNNKNEKGIYVLIMSNYDFPSLDNKVISPKSIKADGFHLKYMGETVSQF